jgi:hypothetical protein
VQFGSIVPATHDFPAGEPFARYATTRYSVIAEPFADGTPIMNFTFPLPRFVIDVNVGAEGFALVTIVLPMESFAEAKLAPTALNAVPEIS